MSNYLKKLAYVHEAMKKLAAELSDEQMRQNIENYQNEYRDQYARINGYTPEEAERRIRAKGNWYDTSDMNALRTLMQSSADRRLRRIATGKKTMANKTWNVPVNGQKAKTKMNFSDAMDAMQQKRTQREQARIADEKLRQPRSAVYNSITNPYGMGVGQSTPPATTTFSPYTGDFNLSTDIDPSQFDPNAHGINDSISPSLVHRPISPAKHRFSVTPYTEEQKNLLNKKQYADANGLHMDPITGDLYREKPVDVNAPDYRDSLDSGDPSSNI